MSKVDFITHEELKRLLHYNPKTGVFTNLIRRGANAEVGTKAGSFNKHTGYCHIKIAGKNYGYHRLAWFYVHGIWPSEIDHIDRNKLNNVITNLREVTGSTNCHNVGIRSTNKSGYNGVSFNKANNNWIASITVKGKRFYLGSFKSVKLANEAREAAEITHR